MRILPAFSLLLLTAASAFPAATTFSFSGDFASPTDVRLFDFSVMTTGTVTLRGFGYGGGMNAAHDMVAAGGFDSVFNLYQSDGTQIGPFDDDPSCTHVTPGPAGCLDSYYSNTLQAGSYILALTLSGNNPNGELSDGFTSAITCPDGFCDMSAPPAGQPYNVLTGHFAFDVIDVDTAVEESATPEPASLGIAGSGLFCLALGLRRRLSNKFSGGAQ